MENRNLFDADYYVYVYSNRIVRAIKTRKAYNSVRIGGVNCYVTNYIPDNIELDDLLYTYSYSSTEDKGFFIPEESGLSEDAKIRMRRMSTKIVILEKFDNAVEMLKHTIIKRTADEDIYNRILMREIEEYENNNNIGSLLEAEFKCSKFKTYDALIESIKLKYSDASEILAYIRYKSFELSKLIEDNNFKGCYDIIKLINQKLGM